MDLKLLKQLIELMKDSDLSEFEIEETDLKLKLRRGPAGGSSMGMPHPVLPAATAPAPAGPAADEPGICLIKSPMVGTFYRAASPESGAFVNDGSKVTHETVVCIIEAMKVMNEIQAEVKGSIIEALVENGQAVEYGQPLFKVKAD